MSLSCTLCHESREHTCISRLAYISNCGPRSVCGLCWILVALFALYFSLVPAEKKKAEVEKEALIAKQNGKYAIQSREYYRHFEDPWLTPLFCSCTPVSSISFFFWYIDTAVGLMAEKDYDNDAEFLQSVSTIFYFQFPLSTHWICWNLRICTYLFSQATIFWNCTAFLVVFSFCVWICFRSVAPLSTQSKN